MNLRMRHGILGVPTDQQLEEMARREGLQVDYVPLRGRLMDIRCEDSLAIRADLPRAWRRWLLAHGLTHFLCHCGNQIALGVPSLHVSRQERKAELAAGRIFWNHLINGPILQHGLTAWELAQVAEVPPECAARWQSLMYELDGGRQMAASVFAG